MPRANFLRFVLPAVVSGLAWVACSGSAGPIGTASDEERVTIEGRVTADDGGPLAGVEVALQPVSLTTVTDASGNYEFTVSASGETASSFVLEVRSEGYETVSLQVVVARGGTAVVDVTMESIAPEPDPEPDPEPEPEPEPSGIVVISSSEDEIGCIAAGVELPFTVRIANEGLVPVEAIVLHDTLDQGLFTRVLTSSDIVVDRSSFPDAVVILNPDGHSFRVELGTVPPMAPAEVYTVTLPAADAGVFCNRISAVGAGGRQLASDISCVTNTLAMEIDLENEDGAIVGGAFTPDPEVFHVGDGGPDRPDGLVFRVVVANHHCGSVGFPMGDSSLTSVLGGRSGALEFREVLPGFPSQGSIVSSTTGGFVWSIGTLSPGAEAEIRFRAEAVQGGEDVHRVELTVPQLTGTIVNEEPVTILP